MGPADRFEALEGWAEVIVDALHGKEPARVVDPRALREVRELSWALRDKLHVLRIQLAFSPSSADSARGWDRTSLPPRPEPS